MILVKRIKPTPSSGDLIKENVRYSRSAFFVAVIGLGATIEQQLGTVGVAESHCVEQCSASVGIDEVDLGAAQRHQRLQTVAVPSTRRTVQCCQSMYDQNTHHRYNETKSIRSIT